MSGNRAEGAASPGDRFATLAALREAHYGLLRRRNRGAQDQPSVLELTAFLRAAAATGTWLETQADRAAAQSILDYWAAELIAWPHEEVAPEVLELAAFDTRALPDLSEHPSPFMGLNAFAEGDAPRFFGREDVAQSLLAVVREKSLVIVSGRSGSGKSSLVMAGLLPLLRDDRSSHWKVLGVAVPGGDPLGALLGLLPPPGQPDAAVREQDRSALARDPAFLRRRIDEVEPSGLGVLVFDQFEEIFSGRIADDTRSQTAAALAAVGERHRVVLTVRSDYLDRVRALPELQALTKDPAVWMQPPPLTPRQLRAAIERPAATAGLAFEEGLVRELVREVEGDAEALPLLQFTLARLWDERERNRITLDAYRVVGRPREALQRSAETVYQGLRPEQQRLAERVFLRLVQPAPGEEFVRRRVRRDELEALAAANQVTMVLLPFVRAGLLRESSGVTRGDDRFDVVHEALIRHWPRLGSWLRERRQELDRELQLIGTARQWRQSGEGREYLLRGRALAEAEALREADSEIAALVRASEAEDERSKRWGQVFRWGGVGVLVLVVVVLAGSLLFARMERETADEARAQAVYANEIAQKRLNEMEEAQRDTRDAIAERERAEAQAARLEAALRIILEQIRRGMLERREVPSVLIELLPQESAAVPSDGASLAALRGRGFAADFLGIPLPLPELRAPRIPADRVLGDDVREWARYGGQRLDYPHFTVVLNDEQRMATIGASNLDRSRRIAVPISLPRFIYDPRVPQDVQPAPDWFSVPDINRGYLVTRDEVAWSGLPLGGAEGLDEARVAADAVNTFPNITPQLTQFNLGVWAQLERWVQSEHNPAATRVNLYAGPVFTGDDPMINGIRLPRQFWKIAASRGPNGALVVDAFLLDQQAGKSESQTFDPETSRVSIAELEQITGLNFGSLRWASDRKSKPAESAGEQLAASIPLLNADQATVRAQATQRIIDGVRDGKIAPDEQRIVVAALVDAMRTEALRRWTATGRYNLIFVLSEIPAESWSRLGWEPLRDSLRDSIRALKARVQSGETAAGTDTLRLLERLENRIAALPHVTSLQVFAHVADKGDSAAAEAIGRNLGPQWPLAGVEYVPAWGSQLRTAGEVRYYRPDDKSAATKLAGALEAATRSRTGSAIPFKAIDISKTFPNLPGGRIEVWFPQLKR